MKTKAGIAFKGAGTKAKVTVKKKEKKNLFNNRSLVGPRSIKLRVKEAYIRQMLGLLFRVQGKDHCNLK